MTARVIDELPFDPDLTRIRTLKARQTAQRGRLPAPAGSKQHGNLSGREYDAHIVERRGLPVFLGQVSDLHAHPTATSVLYLDPEVGAHDAPEEHDQTKHHRDRDHRQRGQICELPELPLFEHQHR